MRRFLLVDDERNVLNALQRAMRQHLLIEDLRIELFTDPMQALARCCECQFDLVISDQRMPGMSGVDFLNTMREVAPATVRLMLSASTDFDTALAAINEAQVFRFIAKPWRPEELQENIREALLQRDGLLEAERLLDAARRAPPTAQESEARRLEADEPGIMKVRWGPDGSVIL